MRSSVLLQVVSLVTLAGALNAQRLITSVAGSELSFRGDGRPAREAPLGRISALTIDSAGRPVFADPYYHMILRLESDGRITVVAGNGVRGHSGDGGPARLAALNTPAGVAYDAAGNLYISDQRNHRIRRVSPDGIITTYAGTGTFGYAGDGGPANRAQFNQPHTLATDSRGNLFVNDASNGVIRRINANGVIETVAGNRESAAGPDGPARQTSFAVPETMATDAEGNLYIAELNGHRVRRLSPQGQVTTVAGTGQAGFAGDGGPATRALLSFPSGVAVNRDGSLVIVDAGNQRVRRVNPQGVIQTIAGSGGQGYSDGPAIDARFRNGFGVVLNSSGDIFIADRDNFRLRRLSGTTVSTVAGNGGLQSSQDGGSRLNVPLQTPFGVSFDSAGNMLIADTESSVIRLVTPSGIARTIAGNGSLEYSGDRGPATQAGLARPRSATVDCRNRVLIADTGNHSIRRINEDGTIEVIAGDGSSEAGDRGDGGPANRARLDTPYFAVSDRNCNIYIADTNNNRVRMIDNRTGNISTVAGGGSSTGDGAATSLRLGVPVALAVDEADNLYIAEVSTGRIRRLASGRLTTVAGGGSAAPTTNPASATSVDLPGPVGVALDGCGRIYISDYRAHQVFGVENNRLWVIAGDGRAAYSGDGGSAAAASLNEPFGIAATEGSCTAPGPVYVADSENNRIRAILPIQPGFTPGVETLSLDVTSDGSEETATLTLNTDHPGLVCEVRPVESWLDLTTTTVTLPASVNVRVNPAGLQQGTVRGSINVRCGAARVPERTVAVSLNVKSAEAPRLSVEAEAINVSIVAGTPTVERQFSVRNTGSGTLNLDVTAATTSGGDWLTTNNEGSVTASRAGTVAVVCNTAQLGPGTYTGMVRVQGNGNQEPVEIPVHLTVNPAPGKIALSQSGLTFTTVSGGGAPLPQEVIVRNAGEGLMVWSASTTTTAGNSWLRVTEPNGRVNATAEAGSLTGVTVDPSGLAPGTYYGRVQVSAEGAANSPQSVGVVLNVLEPGANPGPEVRPTALSFRKTETGNPGAQVVQIANLSNRPLSYSSSRASTGGSWINVVPANATLAPGEQLRVVVQPDLTGIESGVQTGSLDLRFDDGSSRRIELMAVVPDGAAPYGQKGIRAQSGGCPSRLLLQLTSGQQPIRTRAGQPVNLETQITDDCGNPVQPGTNTRVIFSLATGEDSGPLTHASGGRWTRTFQTRSAAPGTKVKAFVTVFTATSGQRVLSEQFPIEVEVEGSGGAVPLIGPGALLNAASLEPHAPVAPGMLITVKGQDLGDDPGVVAQNSPLPVELGSTEVDLGGRPLRLLFASNGQVNAQVPFDITADTEHQVVVRYGNAESVPQSFVVASAHPAVFTENQAGSGQAVAVSATTNQLGANRANPARAGEILSIYATGLGQVTPAIEAGAPAPMDRLVTTVNPVEVTVGGVPAQVQFAGLQPGGIGTYQINFTIPEGVQPGDEVPVVLTVNRQSSPPVTIAVR